MLRHAAVIAAVALFSVPAQAKIVEYRADLNGQSNTINTGSTARAGAQIIVDTAQQTVAIRLDVKGLPLGALWDTLVKAPIGPIHLHQYANNDLANAGNSELAFPLVFGPNYKPTRDGFRVRTDALDYAKAVAPLAGKMTFESFVAALDKGTVVMNIHTDKHQGGEINGLVMKRSKN
jgi:hypothetical protein